MKPLLHWSPRSPYVRKVMVGLHEKGLADQVDLVRTWADPLFPPDPFFGINPHVKIPTLEIAGQRPLFDSRVILEWADLEGTQGPSLFPADKATRLAALRDEAFGTGMIEIGVTLLIELALRPEEQRNPHLVAANRRKFVEVLDHLESTLPEIAARPFDVGHLAIGVGLCYYDFRFADQEWRRNRPRLAGWHAEFAARPSVIATAFRDDPRPTG